MINDVIEKLQSIHEGLGFTAPRGSVRTMPTLPATIITTGGGVTGWGASPDQAGGGLRRMTRQFTVWLITASATEDEDHFAETADALERILEAYPPVTEEWNAISITDEGVTANIRLYDLSNQPYWGAKIVLEITQKA